MRITSKLTTVQFLDNITGMIQSELVKQMAEAVH